MTISLVSLAFHDLNLDATAPLRRNRDTSSLFLSPEWRAGRTTETSQSPIALIANPGQDSPDVSVQATFRRSGHGLARQAAFIRTLATPDDENILGAVKETGICFAEGEAVTQTIMTLQPRHCNRVAHHDDTLEWQYRQEYSTHWQPLASTRHRVYVILDQPGPPWSTDIRAAESWLWTEVLDVACIWAECADSVDAAANAITRSIYALGDVPMDAGGLRYAGLDQQYVSSDEFYCGDFLAHLRGEPDWPAFVECSDVAAAVSTFSNALGCQLRQLQLRLKKGSVKTKQIELIGSSTPKGTSFSFHEVACTKLNGNIGAVWDGCLAIDAVAPMTGGAKLPLGVKSLSEYWEEFSTDEFSTVKTCIFEQNRFLGHGSGTGTADCGSSGDGPAIPLGAGQPSLLFLGKALPDKVPKWRLRRSTTYSYGLARQIDSFWTPDSDQTLVVRAQIFLSTSGADAQTRIKGLLAESAHQIGLTTDQEVKRHLFPVGNLAVRVSPSRAMAGADLSATGDLADALHKTLKGATMPSGDGKNIQEFGGPHGFVARAKFGLKPYLLKSTTGALSIVNLKLRHQPYKADSEPEIQVFFPDLDA